MATCTCTDYQKHVETMETMSEESDRIKAYSCIAPSAARDGGIIGVGTGGGTGHVNQYESAYFSALYADSQLLCSLCGLKRSHAFNSASFKHNNQI